MVRGDVCLLRIEADGRLFHGRPGSTVRLSPGLDVPPSADWTVDEAWLPTWAEMWRN